MFLLILNELALNYIIYIIIYNIYNYIIYTVYYNIYIYIYIYIYKL